MGAYVDVPSDVSMALNPNIVHCIADIALDFFIAGSETTTTTLKWALLYMQHYPEVQRKVGPV